jgi:hypothetical protein
MTSIRSTRSNPTADERAPLLAHDDVRRHSSTPSEEREVSVEPEKATSRTWYYVWRGVCAIFAILVVAVFVKGWIDADDVNVSLDLSARNIPH